MGNTTRNNYLRYTRALFNALKVREIILKNPCDNIGDLPEEIGKNIAFQEDQQTLLEHWMKSNDLSLYILTKFIYYSFIRPKELVHLQIAHIDLINRQIIVPAKTSKNKKQDFVTINKSLAAIIEKLNLEQYPRSYYLFSKELKPGKEKIHRNRLTDRHREALKSTKLYNNELTLYSWKHTGVVNAYRAGVDIKTLQIQLRHHSLEMTDIYLKSLGLKVSKELIDKEW